MLYTETGLKHTADTVRTLHILYNLNRLNAMRIAHCKLIRKRCAGPGPSASPSSRGRSL